MPATAKVELFTGPVSALGRRMAVLRLTPGETSRPDLNHTALILDCSASMYGSLESVKADARQFVSELDEKDYVSVIIFSGHGTRQLISGPTRCDDTGRSLLDKAIRDRVHIMDLTVFSEPLELVLGHLRQNEIKGMASQAVLFTDGCAVPTRWSVKSEHSRAIDMAEELYRFGAAVSVIGYGYYYDHDFVTRLMKAGGSSGIFRHMSDVEDFGEVIRDVRNTFSRTDLTNITLTINPASGAVTAVYRSLPEVQQLSTSQTVNTRGLFDGSLTYYLDVTHAFDMAHIVATINGAEKVLAPDAMPLTPELEADCVRVTAAHLVLTGQTAEAIELLQQTGDDGVAESVAEAYTERDRRTNSDRIRRAFRDKRFIGAGLKASGPNHCILNVLRTLMEDPAVVLSIPAGAYKRGGLLTKDDRVIPSPLGSTVRVVSYTSKKDRLNFSVTTQKEVKVRPVDDDDNIIDTAKPVDAVVHRTYNLVRDGELVMRQIYASMSEGTFNELQAAGVIDASKAYQADTSYLLDLGDMKMVSSAWARPSSLRLVDLLREEAELKAEQTALNAHIKRLGKPDVPEFDGNVYIEKSKVVEDAVKEYYTAPIVELRLMKYKVQYTDDTAGLSLGQAITRVKEVRRRLRVVRFVAREIICACHLTGWQSISWSAAQPAPRSDKFEQLATLNGAQLKLVTGELEVAAS